MTAVELRTYDPLSQAKWESLDEAGKALWRQALEEMHEYGRARAETKSAWRATLRDRRKVRSRSYATTADVATRIMHVLECRAALNRCKLPAFPDPESFSSLREIRTFFTEQMQAIKDARIARSRRPVARPLPVLPRGEGPFFADPEKKKVLPAEAFGLAVHDNSIILKSPITQKSGQDAGQLLTQAFFIPDIDNGFAVIVITQKIGAERFVCFSGKSAPARFRKFLPELATAVAERLFPEEDRNSMQFFVHHPVEYGERNDEQYWKYDLRPDARGDFRMAARQQMQVVPYAITNRQFVDQKSEAETSILTLDKFWPWQSQVAGQIMKQEQFSARRASVLARRAARRGRKPSEARMALN